MNCPNCSSILKIRHRLNDSVTGLSFQHFDCDRCGIMYNKNLKPINRNGEEIKEEEDIVIGSDDDDDPMNSG